MRTPQGLQELNAAIREREAWLADDRAALQASAVEIEGLRGTLTRQSEQIHSQTAQIARMLTAAWWFMRPFRGLRRFL